MAENKIKIREDGRVEYVCIHGIGHTIAIPYKLALICKDKANTDAMFSHGCDGCCKKIV